MYKLVQHFGRQIAIHTNFLCLFFYLTTSFLGVIGRYMCRKDMPKNNYCSIKCNIKKKQNYTSMLKTGRTKYGTAIKLECRH